MTQTIQSSPASLRLAAIRTGCCSSCLLYTSDKFSKDENAPVDIIARAEDASKIQRIFDRFELGKVDKASIVAEAEKSMAEREEVANEVPTKSKGERIVEEAMGKPIQKDGASNENPQVAKTDKNPQSRRSSKEVDMHTDKGKAKSAEERPSVREKLDRYKAEASKDNEACLLYTSRCV